MKGSCVPCEGAELLRWTPGWARFFADVHEEYQKLMERRARAKEAQAEDLTPIAQAAPLPAKGALPVTTSTAIPAKAGRKPSTRKPSTRKGQPTPKTKKAHVSQHASLQVPHI